MGKKRKSQLNRQAITQEMNLAPFVDVLFVLLITFMMSAPVMLGGVKVELPEGDTEVVAAESEPLVVSIKRNGTVYVGDTPVKLKLLPEFLRQASGNDFDSSVYVRADKDLAYERVIRVVGRIHSAGFAKVSLVTELDEV